MLAGTKNDGDVEDGGGGTPAPRNPGLPAVASAVGSIGAALVVYAVGALVSKRVSPGPAGGSSRGAGRRCSAPKPRTQPRRPWPPQLREGVMVTGRVTLYSWL